MKLGKGVKLDAIIPPMRCFRCGEAMPFLGEQCPYCGGDKSGRQTTRLAALVLIAVGFAPGIWQGKFWLFFFGGIIGCLLAYGAERLGNYFAEKNLKK